MSTNSSVREVAVPNIFRNLSNSAPVRAVALLLLFTTAAWYESVHLSALADPDVWWHLSTGNWIVQNHAVPRNGLFTQYSDLPWVASSWLFDVLLAAAYKAMGLRALPVLLMGFKVAIAVATFMLARGSRGNLWPAVALAAIAQYAIPGLPPGPIVCSIILFAIELALLFGSRRAARMRPLYWLPVLFAFWANLDAGFIFGLLVLFLFAGVAMVEELGRRSAANWMAEQPLAVPLRTAAIVAIASLIASFLSPYFFQTCAAAWKDLWSVAPYVRGLRAVSFRQPQDYLLLLLAMTASFSLGRRRSRDLFQVLLMISCLALAFTRQRDIWLLALASVAVIAEALPTRFASAERQNSNRTRKREKLATVGLVLIGFVAAVVSRVPASREALLNKVSESFPVRACDYIRANHLPPPLFNTYDWGGFLTWYLPEYPVSIDSRTALYGDEIDSRYFNLISGQIRLNADSSFTNARSILLPKDLPMAVALSAAPQFKVAYHDDVATVLLQGE